MSTSGKTKKTQVARQYSRFVAPGSVRVEASPAFGEVISSAHVTAGGENAAYSSRARTRRNRLAWLAFLALLALSSSVGRAAGEGHQPSVKPSNVRVAGVVLKWLRGDKEANYRRIEPLIREADAHGAQIVCTTECFLDGYAIADKSIPLVEYRALGEPIPDGIYCRKLASLAKELKIFLIAGMLEADGEQRFNTAALMSPSGELVGKYHKQQLEHEAVRNTAGKESPVFETPFGKLGVMICADRRWPETARTLTLKGARVIFNPTYGMHGDLNLCMMRTRSYENGIFIVFTHPGQALITGPDGQVVCNNEDKSTTFIVTQIDLSEAPANKGGHIPDRRTDIYKL